MMPIFTKYIFNLIIYNRRVHNQAWKAWTIAFLELRVH